VISLSSTPTDGSCGPSGYRRPARPKKKTEPQTTSDRLGADGPARKYFGQRTVPFRSKTSIKSGRGRINRVDTWPTWANRPLALGFRQGTPRVRRRAREKEPVAREHQLGKEHADVDSARAGAQYFCLYQTARLDLRAQVVNSRRRRGRPCAAPFRGGPGGGGAAGTGSIPADDISGSFFALTADSRRRRGALCCFFGIHRLSSSCPPLFRFAFCSLRCRRIRFRRGAFRFRRGSTSLEVDGRPCSGLRLFALGSSRRYSGLALGGHRRRRRLAANRTQLPARRARRRQRGGQARQALGPHRSPGAIERTPFRLPPRGASVGSVLWLAELAAPAAEAQSFSTAHGRRGNLDGAGEGGTFDGRLRVSRPSARRG